MSTLKHKLLNILFSPFGLIVMAVLATFGGTFLGEFTVLKSHHNLQVKHYKSGALESEEDYYGSDKDWWTKRDVWNTNGWKKTYYENGKLKSLDSYEDGRLHGLCQEYWDNGVLNKEYKCVHGERDGEYNEYSYDGHLTSVLLYSSGQIIKSKWYSKKIGWYGDYDEQ